MAGTLVIGLLFLIAAGILTMTAILPAADRIDRHEAALVEAEAARDAAATARDQRQKRLDSLADPFTVLRILVSDYHWQPTDQPAGDDNDS